MTSSSNHKFNKNTLIRRRFSSSTDSYANKNGETKAESYVTESVYDNAFIQHPIPRSDFQYTWITQSVVEDRRIDFVHGYATSSAWLSGNYVTASQLWVDQFDSSTQGDRFYITKAVYTPTYLISTSNEADTLPLNTSIDGPASFAYLYVFDIDDFEAVRPDARRGSAGVGGLESLAATLGYRAEITAFADQAARLQYGGRTWGTWNQIRGSEHAIMQNLRRTSSIDIAYYDQRDIGFVKGRSIYPRIPRRNKSYYESLMTSKYKPFVHTVDQLVSKETTLTLPLTLKYDHTSKGKYFIDNNLNTKLDAEYDVDTMYTNLYDKYIDDEIESAIKGFKSLVYSETIWPKAENTYLSKIRDRPVFNFNWKTKRSDRQFIYNTNSPLFFNDLEVYTKKNSQGEILKTGSIWNLDTVPDYPDLSPFVFDTSATKHKGGVGELNSVSNEYHNGDVSILTASAVFSKPLWDFNGDVETVAFTNYSTPVRREPFGNSYGEWVELLRAKGKDYSVVPEFNASEHMDYYVNTASGDFLTDLEDIFTVTGSSTPDSSNASFFKIYNSSDFLEDFEKIRKDHTDVASPTRLELKVKALMKFTPRQGFYPVERLVQLAEIFSQSYSEGVTLTGSQPFWGSAIKPFYAPGIAFNSIKAGLAMDYALVTRSLGNNAYQNEDRPLFDNVSTGFSYIPTLGRPYAGVQLDRIPFESILDPSSYVLNDFLDYIPHTSGNIDCTASLGKFKLNYSLAANNFFASSIGFYNDSSRLSAVFSRPDNDSQFYKFELGKDYRMRVYLRSSDIYDEMTCFRKLASSEGAQSIADSYGANKTNDSNFWLMSHYGSRMTSSLHITLPTFKPTARYNFDYSAISDVVDVNNDSTFTASYYHEGSGYGPPFSAEFVDVSIGQQSKGALNIYGSSDYGIYEPPYLYGYCFVEYSYRPSDTDGTIYQEPQGRSVKKTLENILENLSSSYFSFRQSPLTEHTYFSIEEQETVVITGSDFIALPNYGVANKSQINSCLTLDGVVARKRVEYDVDGNVQNIVEDSTAGDVWSIYPKWETPLLKYNKLSSDEFPSTYQNNVETGYGRQVGSLFSNSGEGLFLQVTDIPKNKIRYTPDSNPVLPSTPTYITATASVDLAKTGSLADAVGFKKDPIRLGNLRSGQTIEEAIVAIPFYEQAGERRFIKMHETTLQNALNGRGSENTINTVNAMKKYVIPPQFDFVKYDGTGGKKKIDPIAMYIFEFKMNFDQDDLRYMWQNAKPKDKIKEAEVTIGHELLKGEILEKIADDKMKWMVFKVKKKADWNYYKKTFDSRDDDRFKFDFQGNDIAKEPDISYNWPYDFCSVVEMAKLEASVTIETPKAAETRRAGLPFVKEQFDPSQKIQDDDLSTARDRFGIGGTPPPEPPPQPSLVEVLQQEFGGNAVEVDIPNEPVTLTDAQLEQFGVSGQPTAPPEGLEIVGTSEFTTNPFATTTATATSGESTQNDEGSGTIVGSAGTFTTTSGFFDF